MKKDTRTYPAAGVLLMIGVLTLMAGQHFICFNTFLEQDVYYYLWVAGLGLPQVALLMLVKGSPDWAYRYLCRFYIMAAMIGIFMSQGAVKYLFIVYDFFGAWYCGSRIDTPKRETEEKK